MLLFFAYMLLLCFAIAAGNKHIKRTGAEGARMKEGININKGLFVLGMTGPQHAAAYIVAYNGPGLATATGRCGV